MTHSNTFGENAIKLKAILAPYSIEHQTLLLLECIPFSSLPDYDELSPDSIISRMHSTTQARLIQKFTPVVLDADFLKLEKTHRLRLARFKKPQHIGGSTDN